MNNITRKILNDWGLLVDEILIYNITAEQLIQAILKGDNSKHNSLDLTDWEFRKLIKQIFPRDSTKHLKYYLLESVGVDLEAQQKEDKKAYDIKYRVENRKKRTCWLATYRASLLDRTPKWVNLIEISEIYEKCPEGYHVDHILPLRGKLVSGLHVENNLQYLTAIDNLSKGNSYSV